MPHKLPWIGTPKTVALMRGYINRSSEPLNGVTSQLDHIQRAGECVGLSVAV
jgi:hypothetical protein